MSEKTIGSNLQNWSFGKYYDQEEQQAYLIIHFTSQGKLALTPFQVLYSEYANPRLVMKKLLDSGADIDPSTDMQSLKDRLSNLDVTDGLYVQHVGHCGSAFLLPPQQFGHSRHKICPSSEIYGQMAA